MWQHQEFVEDVTAHAGEDERMDRLHGHARRLRGAQALADDSSSLGGRWP
jgi:hypothetical protein